MLTTLNAYFLSCVDYSWVLVANKQKRNWDSVRVVSDIFVKGDNFPIQVFRVCEELRVYDGRVDPKVVLRCLKAWNTPEKEVKVYEKWEHSKVSTFLWTRVWR